MKATYSQNYYLKSYRFLNCHLSKPVSFSYWNMSLFCHISESHSVVSSSLWPHGLYGPWNSPGQNTGVGSLSLLQGIFPTQGLNPDLPLRRQILYQLSHKGSPRILEWVALPFSSRSSQPRSGTGFSCIAGGFFTNWAIREQLNELQPRPLALRGASTQAPLWISCSDDSWVFQG